MSNRPWSATNSSVVQVAWRNPYVWPRRLFWLPVFYLVAVIIHFATVIQFKDVEKLRDFVHLCHNFPFASDILRSMILMCVGYRSFDLLGSDEVLQRCEALQNDRLTTTERVDCFVLYTVVSALSPIRRLVPLWLAFGYFCHEFWLSLCDIPVVIVGAALICLLEARACQARKSAEQVVIRVALIQIAIVSAVTVFGSLFAISWCFVSPLAASVALQAIFLVLFTLVRKQAKNGPYPKLCRWYWNDPDQSQRDGVGVMQSWRN